MGGIAVLTTKGQVTIPKPIRDAFNLKKKDRLLFTEEDGYIYVRPLTKSFLEYGNSIKPNKKREDLHKIRDKVIKNITESVLDTH